MLWSKHEINSPDWHGIPIGKDKDSYKYLGVWLTRDGSWDKHVQYYTEKLSKLTGWLMSRRISIEQKISMAHVVINAIIEYGAQVIIPCEKTLKFGIIWSKKQYLVVQ